MQLLARGRDADVFDAGPGRVLRRYRDPSRSTAREAQVMRYAREHGVTVPEVFDADGTDLVMERVDAPTMANALTRQPWRMAAHARLLAAAHASVHRVPGPDWLAAPFEGREALVHLDLHPENVLVDGADAVIIDWTNAASGPPAVDVADAWLITSSGGPPGGTIARAIARTGQAAFARMFLRATRMEIGPALRVAGERRLADPNLRPAESRRIRRLAGLA